MSPFRRCDVALGEVSDSPNQLESPKNLPASRHLAQADDMDCRKIQRRSSESTDFLHIFPLT